MATEMDIDDLPKPKELFKSAEKGDASLFKSLTGDQLNNVRSLRNDDGRSLLHVAAASGQSEVVRIISDVDPSVSGINSKDEEGWAPIHSAASCGHEEIVEILIEKASTGNAELCELLIEEGAEIDATDRAGQTPLMSAVICDNREVALLLIRHGASVDVQDKEGYTVLGRASDDLRPILIDVAKAVLEA
ncbi:uncharacterized protein A4U43_C07F30130 [Asparagus officinalis]|uniref:Uncharacterized protein n=1 Tax=Asparagus officinalis TaxID=4686 RepID=A0A5P1EFY0_ASPOF|nr:uncharacterized protein A4U43_C07F30130 [Asparagus officinalis]